MHGAYGTRHRNRHRGGMLNKTPPPTELQIPATVTTLYISNSCCGETHKLLLIIRPMLMLCHTFEMNYPNKR